MLTIKGNKNPLKALLFVGIILSVMSCTKDKSVDPPGQLTTPFTGITHTDSTGAVVGLVDSSDWKPLMSCDSSQKPLYDTVKSVTGDTIAVEVLPPCTKINPAYPNPAGKFFQITFSLNEEDSVLITLNSAPATVVKELLNRRLAIGSYSFSVDGSTLQPAIYRVYITVFRQSDQLDSYGDVQISK
ncbi:MAG: hypothetical protein WBZ48_09615 [Bacteroidota bacterium]